VREAEIPLETGGEIAIFRSQSFRRAGNGVVWVIECKESFGELISCVRSTVVRVFGGGGGDCFSEGLTPNLLTTSHFRTRVRLIVRDPKSRIINGRTLYFRHHYR
jgi:hypothetical protein